MRLGFCLDTMRFGLFEASVAFFVLLCEPARRRSLTADCSLQVRFRFRLWLAEVSCAQKFEIKANFRSDRRQSFEAQSVDFCGATMDINVRASVLLHWLGSEERPVGLMGRRLAQARRQASDRFATESSPAT